MGRHISYPGDSETTELRTEKGCAIRIDRDGRFWARPRGWGWRWSRSLPQLIRDLPDELPIKEIPAMTTPDMQVYGGPRTHMVLAFDPSEFRYLIRESGGRESKPFGAGYHFDAAVYGKLETLRVRSIELKREFDDAIKQLRPIRRDDFKGE